MTLSDLVKPGMLLFEAFYPYISQKGLVADAVERLSAEGFYKLLEIPDIDSCADRERIKAATANRGILVTQWMSRILNLHDLSLCSVDETKRRKTVSRLKEEMDRSAECNVSYIGVLSGPDPGVTMRKQARVQLYRSLCELCQHASQYQHPMCVMLEPLDRGAHKNGLIGPTTECAELVQQVKADHQNICISWDTAHVALCGEDLQQSFALLAPYIRQVHLANAVLDRLDPAFGDHHIHLGEQGFLTPDVLREIGKYLLATEGLRQFGVGVSVEVRTAEGDDPWDTERHCRHVLEQFVSAS